MLNRMHLQGGAVAIKLAHDKPKLVDKLVLIDAQVCYTIILLYAYTYTLYRYNHCLLISSYV